MCRSALALLLLIIVPGAEPVTPPAREPDVPLFICGNDPAVGGWTPRELPLLWIQDRPVARLIPPRLDGDMRDIVDVTLNGYFADSFGFTLPAAANADSPGFYVLVGDRENNEAIARLVESGLRIEGKDLGPEGFRILTHETEGKRFVIVTANTPVGLKYGCQELAYFHTKATAKHAIVDWPMDISMKPAWSYRGVYMLPCWSAHDSLEHWKRVFRFHSELTINRNWFWLAGFPLIKEYGGQYENTDLANPWYVNGLVTLCRQQGMKFYIGGGWFTWHHQQHAGGSIERGVQYYRDLLALLPESEGIYLEPAGEGRGADEKTWQSRTEAFEGLARTIWKDRPDFEFAVAIGKFNDDSYLRAMHSIDDKRIYWWWCWGDPLHQSALAEHPLILRWHTIVRMSDFHGSNDPPRPDESRLTGFATSYDPGQGYGNPWNGWGALGIDSTREFHPYTMPFFSHQYLFRERCWNPGISEDEFSQRLSRRLFDDDMPAEAIARYLRLAALCPDPAAADQKEVAGIARFVGKHLPHGTRRNRETLMRMQEALDGMNKWLEQQKTKGD